MAKWWESKTKEDGTEEVTVPKVIQDQLDEAKKNSTELIEVKNRLASLDGISSTLNELKESLRPKPQPKTRTAEDERAENEEIAALLLENPQAAYDRMAARTNAGVLQLAAQNAKREVFQDSDKDFPYYHGDIKKEIDSILSEQPLSMQSNVNLIRNTYHTVLGRHLNEIQEGKIKDRFAAASGASRNSQADDDKDKRKITVTPDIERAARLTGIKLEDYVEMLEKDIEAYV